MGIKIYTDGGCSGNPGPGGWAYMIIRGNSPNKENRSRLQTSPRTTKEEGEIITENYGAEFDTTNNRMELTAALESLKALSTLRLPPQDVTVFTDSQYVQKGMSAWIKSWKRNGWRTGERKPVKNRDLWERLDELAANFLIDWQWVKGHAGNRYNERCDQMTRRAVASLLGEKGGGRGGSQRYLSF
ncbi:MAG: ribonuclease HI [Spirochaetaceae bacterium]|jgi:ribonuclease HI|nr:ribonuclease HI [Spirochaetaceae bacterium]